MTDREQQLLHELEWTVEALEIMLAAHPEPHSRAFQKIAEDACAAIAEAKKGT